MMDIKTIRNLIISRLFAGLVLSFLIPAFVFAIVMLGTGIYAFMYDVWIGPANEVFLKMSTDEVQEIKRGLLRTASVIGFLGGAFTNWDNLR